LSPFAVPLTFLVFLFNLLPPTTRARLLGPAPLPDPPPNRRENINSPTPPKKKQVRRGPDRPLRLVVISGFFYACVACRATSKDEHVRWRSLDDLVGCAVFGIGRLVFFFFGGGGEASCTVRLTPFWLPPGREASCTAHCTPFWLPPAVRASKPCLLANVHLLRCVNPRVNPHANLRACPSCVHGEAGRRRSCSRMAARAPRTRPTARGCSQASTPLRAATAALSRCSWFASGR